MAAEFTYFLHITVGLFVIINPFAVVPVYLTLTDNYSAKERVSIRRRASLVSLSILLMFALFGLGIFKVFSITLPAFRIAGGILLLMFGLSQMHSKRERLSKHEEAESLERDDISIFPLAMPLLAGPGAISTVVLYSSKAKASLHIVILMLSIAIVLYASHVIIGFSPVINRTLGKTGLNLLTRLMGIILTAIAVQFIIIGIKEAFGL